MLPRNHVFFGAPGVGKGVQAALLSRREKIPHISTGAILRDEIAAGTAVGRRVKVAIDRGEFADDETILELIARALDRPDAAGGFIMDGFPRTTSQVRRFDEILADRGWRIECALLIDAPEAVVIRRLRGRIVCASCGRSYHSEFDPPRVRGRCDDCRGPVTRRDDDRPEAHRERLRIFRDRTRPILTHYREAGVLVEVDGDGSIEVVEKRIAAARRRSTSRSAVS